MAQRAHRLHVIQPSTGHRGIVVKVSDGGGAVFLQIGTGEVKAEHAMRTKIDHAGARVTTQCRAVMRQLKTLLSGADYLARRKALDEEHIVEDLIYGGSVVARVVRRITDHVLLGACRDLANASETFHVDSKPDD